MGHFVLTSRMWTFCCFVVADKMNITGIFCSNSCSLRSQCLARTYPAWMMCLCGTLHSSSLILFPFSLSLDHVNQVLSLRPETYLLCLKCFLSARLILGLLSHSLQVLV